MSWIKLQSPNVQSNKTASIKERSEKGISLTSVVQLVGCHPAKQKFEELIPGQGTYRGCRFSPWPGCERQPIDDSLLHCPCFPFFLLQERKERKKDGGEKERRREREREKEKKEFKGHQSILYLVFIFQLLSNLYW